MINAFEADINKLEADKKEIVKEKSIKGISKVKLL